MKLKPLSAQILAVAVALGLTVLHMGCSGEADSPESPTPQGVASSEATSPEPAADSETVSTAAVPPMTAEGSTTKPASEGQAGPATTVAEPDPFIVPEGTPEEMFEYLQTLQSQQPSARDTESIKTFMGKLGQAVLTASDRILAAKPSDEQTKEAIQYKLAGLGLLEQSGDTSATAKRDAMPAELEAAGHGSLVRFVELDGLVNRLQKLGASSPEGIATFVDDLATFFEKSPPEPQEAQLAMQVAGNVEGVLEPEQVAKAYERYGKAFAGLDDEQAAEMGAMMVGAARRMRLVGNEMPLEGLSVDGEEFQWDEYRGKVVLVDFWATWCRPCLDEMVNIRENYEKYHDRGFDVIGISIDDNRIALVSYLKNNDLPWPVLVDNDLKQADRETMSIRYGVFGIPNVTLVGKDGKVIAVNTRGPELGARLAELLGDEEAATPPPAMSPPESKDAPAESKEAPAESKEAPAESKEPPAESKEAPAESKADES